MWNRSGSEWGESRLECTYFGSYLTAGLRLDLETFTGNKLHPLSKELAPFTGSRSRLLAFYVKQPLKGVQLKGWSYIG